MSHSSSSNPTNEDLDRTTITSWLNDAATCQHATERIELLHKTQEFLIHKTPELLPELLTDCLSFASDRNADVKKSMVGFIEEVCKYNEELIPKVIIILHMLLCDEAVQVQKRVIKASGFIYRNMILWLSKASVVSDEMEQAWNGLNQIKVEIVNMIDSDNDGVRTHSIKFLEGVVLLQTYPETGASRKTNDFSLEDIPLTLKIARRRKLEEEANHIFSLLVKFHGSPHISSVNLMACMGALCNIAKLRPEFMERVVNALDNLHSNLPPTLSHSQVSSVRKHLKLQLINILKHPACGDVRTTITPLLSELGCSSQELARLVPRGIVEEKKRLPKRTSPDNSAPVVFNVSKKAKLTQELENRMEEMEKQKQQANEKNHMFIMEHLNVYTATQIVLATMKHIPQNMPSYFTTDYAKLCIRDSVSNRDIAKLLAEQLTEAEVGPGAKIYQSLNEPQLPLPTIQTGVKRDRSPSPPPPSTENVSESSKVTDKLNREMKRAAAQVVSRPRPVKTLKLFEITRPLGSKLREQMLIDAVHRLLRAERVAFKVGVAHTRYKIITTLASTFSAPVREAILKFLLEDMRLHMDLALAWLYEEYSLMQGFNRMPAILRREEKPDKCYNTLLCSLISNLQVSVEVRERDGLLARVFLEAPMITDEALSMLKGMCTQGDRCVTALNLMHDLVVRRPPRGAIFLSGLLTYSTYEEPSVRDEAIARVVSIYERPEWQPQIEKHAMRHLEMLQQPEPPDELFTEDYGTERQDTWNDELNKLCLALYLALLPYNESLIHELSRVYTQTSADVKRTILRLLETPVRGMGMESQDLLMLVEKCPKGAETLVTRIIHILSDRGPPSIHLVSRVRELYNSRVSDVRFLIPVLNGLTKKEVTAALPKLIKLNPVVVKEVFNRLLGLNGTGDSPISPSDLLIALHLIDPGKAEIKAVMKATSLCFAEKQVYTQEVLAVVMQQLMDVSPLPTLLMRTVIQSLSLYPRLTGFVMNILQRLILKQVWRQKVVWEGFIKCCQRTKPQSYQVMLQLPPPQLAEALSVCPDMHQPLLEHVLALTETQRAHVAPATMDVLTGRTDVPCPPGEDVQIVPPVEGLLIRSSSVDSNLEPLPPGMD